MNITSTTSPAANIRVAHERVAIGPDRYHTAVPIMFANEIGTKYFQQSVIS